MKIYAVSYGPCGDGCFPCIAGVFDSKEKAEEFMKNPSGEPPTQCKDCSSWFGYEDIRAAMTAFKKEYHYDYETFVCEEFDVR